MKKDKNLWIISASPMAFGVHLVYINKKDKEIISKSE
jgi:hypothetical protein